VKESVSRSPSEQEPSGLGISLQSTSLPASLVPIQEMLTSTEHGPVGGSDGDSDGGSLTFGRSVGGCVSGQPYSPGLQVGRGVGCLVIEEP